MTTTCTMIMGDCLKVMPDLPAAGAHMAFCDLPYATQAKTNTALAWDVPADLTAVWQGLNHGCSHRANQVFTANLPFAVSLYLSNTMRFKYDLVHLKQIQTGFLSADRAPLRAHECILVFGKGDSIYNAQMMAKDRQRSDNYGTSQTRCYDLTQRKARPPNDKSFPSSAIAAKWERSRFVGSVRSLHPTQKPVALLDWLIRTYSNEGDMVLDPTAGSFTTCVSACANGRSSVGIERDENYFQAGVERVRKHCRDNLLDVKIEVRR